MVATGREPTDDTASPTMKPMSRGIGEAEARAQQTERCTTRHLQVRTSNSARGLFRTPTQNSYTPFTEHLHGRTPAS